MTKDDPQVLTAAELELWLALGLPVEYRTPNNGTWYSQPPGWPDKYLSRETTLKSIIEVNNGLEFRRKPDD